jgi:hypothetical protein
MELLALSTISALSEVMTPQGRIHKLDLIATISIDGTPFLTVYRRYNSVHEIIVMDCQNDIYLQPDLPLLESLRRVLCLSQTDHVRVAGLFSVKHHGSPPTGHPCPLNMYWSEIQLYWQAITINLVDVWECSFSTASTAFSVTTSASDADHNLAQLLLSMRETTSSTPDTQTKKRSWTQKELDTTSDSILRSGFVRRKKL